MIPHLDERPTHPRLRAILTLLLPPKLPAATRHDTPRQSVRKGESMAAVMTMDVGAAMAVVAAMGRQQTFESRSTHCVRESVRSQLNAHLPAKITFSFSKR